MARLNSSRALIRNAFLFFFISLAGVPAQESSRMASTTSASGQFVVYCNDATRRSVLVRRAEEARTEWRRRFPSSEEKTYPIIIQDLTGTLRPRGNLPATTNIYESDGGALKVQTNIYDAGILRSQVFDAEIFRALGLERMYRKKSVQAGKVFRVPPAWMIEGLAEDMRVRENGVPDGVYATLLQGEYSLKIDDFLKAKPELMEATSLALYRTQALALLRGLEQLPEGTQGFSTLLESFAEGDFGTKSIFAAYPSLNNDRSQLIKIWTLSIARGSAAKPFNALSVSETERQLASILALKADVDPKKPGTSRVEGPAALPLVARGKGGAFIMREKSTELLHLEFQSHPLLKPIIEEYRNITTLLAKKPKKNVEKQIEENGKIRVLLQQRNQQLIDYLNWFEATQLDTLSDDFLNITEPPAAPRRTDPITRHLDAIDQRGW